MRARLSVAGREHRLLLAGGSMAPALREGDLLRIEPLDGALPRVGDVVAFRAGGPAPVVVHRVVGIRDGILTRGDGARHGDAGRLEPARLLGRVVSARRGTREFAVAGGPRGRIRGALGRCRNRCLRTAATLLGPFRALLPPPGWAGALLPAAAQPRVVRFESPGRVERRVLVGGRVAGRFDEASGAWRIRIRYRPFVRTERLPGA